MGTETRQRLSERFEAVAESALTGMTQRRRWVLALLAMVTAAALLLATRVGFDNSIEIWFMENDADLVAYEEFYRRFQADEFVVIGLTSDNVFGPETLAVIDRISEDVRSAPFVHRVRSILTVHDAATETDPAALMSRALESDLVRGTLVAADGRMTAIVAELDRDGNTVEGKRATVAAIRDIVERHRSAPIGVAGLTGTPVLDDTSYSYNDRDLRLLSPVMFVIIATVVYLVFGSLLATVLPLVIVMTAAAWSVGLMGLLGQKMTLMSSALIPLVLAVGVADSIHMLAEYRSQRAAATSHERAAIRSVSTLLIPCLFTTITTVIGLLSLCVSELAPLREFAVTAAAGVFFAFLISVLLIPSALHSFPLMADSLRRAPGSNRIVPVLRYLVTVSRARSHLIVFVAIALCVAAAWSISRIDVGVNPMAWLPESSAFRTETEIIDASLNGTTSLEFLVHAPEAGLGDPVTLRDMEAFQRWLVENTSVAQTISVVEFLKDARRIAYPGIEVELPATRSQVSRLYDEIETRDDLDGWLSGDGSTGRISARLPLSSSGELLNRLPEIQSKLDETRQDTGLHIKMTGYVKLMAAMQGYLVDSQIRSLALAFSVITVLMFTLLRSWKLACFALIPNVTPILLGLGAMGIFGVDLTPGTVMIGAILMGLVVDDTVHFLLGLQRRLNMGANEEQAIGETVTEVGQALTITSVVLATGFGALTLGSYAPNIHFGAIAAMVIAVALGADVVLLPAALRVLRNPFGEARSDGLELIGD